MRYTDSKIELICHRVLPSVTENCGDNLIACRIRWYGILGAGRYGLPRFVSD